MAKLGFFILSFCRSVKESIKESAFERRQELPAGTGAAPLRQHLKSGTDYRDETTALKMKRLRRLWGDRRTFLAVAMIFRQRRLREQGASAHAYFTSISKSLFYQNVSKLHYTLFPFLLFRRNKRKNQPRMGGEAEKTSAFEMVSSKSFGFIPFYQSILQRVAWSCA